MTVHELIEKHVGKDKVFQEKFHDLTVKEAFGTISIEELAELERMDNERDEQSPRELDTDNLSQFAIELLEMVKESSHLKVVDPGVYVGTLEAQHNYGDTIQAFLDELKKDTP